MTVQQDIMKSRNTYSYHPITPGFMVTSSNEYFFPRYWPCKREFTGPRWISLTKASDAELWRFLWSAPE